MSSVYFAADAKSARIVASTAPHGQSFVLTGALTTNPVGLA